MTGHADEPVRTASGGLIYYRGQQLFDALMDNLLTVQGLDMARTLVYAGCSAGALTAYLHADQVAARLPPTVQLMALADGMFALPAPAWNGEPLIERAFSWALNAWNASGSLPAACLKHHGLDGAWRCLLGGEVARFVRVPLFTIGSKWDLWQGCAIIGANGTIGDVAPPVREYWLRYGQEMQRALEELPASSAFFVTGCVAHCQTGSARTDPWSRGAYNGTSINETLIESSVGAWYTTQLLLHWTRQQPEHDCSANDGTGPGANASVVVGLRLRWLDRCGAQPCVDNVCGNTIWRPPAHSSTDGGNWPKGTIENLGLLAVSWGAPLAVLVTAVWYTKKWRPCRRRARLAGAFSSRAATTEGDQLAFIIETQ